MRTRYFITTRIVAMSSILICSLFIQELYGQGGLLKKLKNAANKEINKVISPTTPVKTPPESNQNNVPGNNAPANTTEINNVNKTNQADKQIPEEIHIVGNSSGLGINPTICNNKIYSIGSDYSTKKYWLIEYDGTNEKIIPISGLIKNFDIEKLLDTLVVCKNKIYISLYGQIGLEARHYTTLLLQYDGLNLTAIPQGDRYDIAKPFSFNGQLYFLYYHYNTGTLYHKMGEEDVSTRLATFDGTKLIFIKQDSLVENPLFGPLYSSIEQPHFPILYKNKMYFGCTPLPSLWYFDGKSLEIVKDLIELTLFNRTAMFEYPLIYHDKMYFQYQKGSLAQFDGKTFKIITGPDGFNIDDRNNSSPFFIYKDKLYYILTNSSVGKQLASFDGNNIVLIPNLSMDAIKIFNREINYYDNIQYDGKVFFRESQEPVIQFDGTKLAIVAKSEKEHSRFFPVFFKGTLYGDVHGHSGHYEVNEVNLIRNTEGGYVEFNGKLYFTYQPYYNDKPKLAYLDKAQ